jgi:hypothetical protein
MIYWCWCQCSVCQNQILSLGIRLRRREAACKALKEKIDVLKDEQWEMKDLIKDLKKELKRIPNVQSCGYCEVEMKPNHWPDCKHAEMKKEIYINSQNENRLPSDEVTPASVSLLG